MTSAAAPPFHVLLLAGGNKSKKDAKPPFGDGDASDGGGDAEPDVDDYLFRRNVFRKESRARKGGRDAKAAPARIAKNDTGPSSSSSAAAAGSGSPLRRLASPLEAAMGACCERVAAAHVDDRGAESSPRSRNQTSLHRPLFPANYAAQDPPPESSSSSSEQNDSNGRNWSKTCGGGILREGKEVHFLKLLAMYCHRSALGHRALAVAILQSTVDWENASDDASGAAKVGGRVKEEGQHSRTVNTKIEGGSKQHCKRIRSFLLAGGMKLLAHWLVDSYTLVQAPSGSFESGEIQGKRVVASPTGCLLLPLLHFLKCIPFDKKLVVASHIHKYIKRLKKALDVLVKRLDYDSLERQVHPIAGGLSVGKVVAAVDEVMTSWSQAAAAVEKDDASFDFDPFAHFKEKLRTRFDELAKFQSVGGEPPVWLPKSVVGLRRMAFGAANSTITSNSSSDTAASPSDVKALDQVNGKQSTWLASQTSAGTDRRAPHLGKRKDQDNTEILERIQARLQKHKARRESVEQISKPPSKRVSWVDRPKHSSMAPRPLKEERIFVPDTSHSAERHTESQSDNEIDQQVNINIEENNNDTIQTAGEVYVLSSAPQAIKSEENSYPEHEGTHSLEGNMKDDKHENKSENPQEVDDSEYNSFEEDNVEESSNPGHQGNTHLEGEDSVKGNDEIHENESQERKETDDSQYNSFEEDSDMEDLF